MTHRRTTTSLPTDKPALPTGSQRLEQYVRDVLDGKIIACKKVRMACQRHLDDLKRSQTSDWPYRFDAERADRAIGFFERFLRPSKGEITRMELMPWQCFVEGSLYGWVDKQTGLRRYREGLVCVGRGNGKSTMMSGNAAYLCSKDGERGADVYLLANSKEQASIVYRECATQIASSPALCKHFEVRRDVIRYPSTHSVIQHRASDSRKLDGLNPHGAVFDEIHAMRDFKLINVVKRGMNKRRQPLMIYITTMGSVLDGPLMYYYGLFGDALLGSLRPDVADRMFAFICEMDAEDDIEDSRLWVKANPAIGVLLNQSNLEADWARCKQIPSERADFINKQLNIFTDASDAPFVDFDVVKRNEDWIEMGLLEGRECFGGFDLATSEDMTAAGLEFQLDDGRYFWLCHAWTTRKKVELDLEKIPYHEYALNGWLSIVDGDYVAQDEVYKWFETQVKHYAIRAIGYDPANATWLVRMLEASGLPCKVVRQGPLTLNAPMKDLREVLLDGRLVHNRNALFRWFLQNVKLRTGYGDEDKANWVPTKRQRYRKIDGFAALLDAHTLMLGESPLPDGFAPELDVSIYSLDL